MVVTELSCYFPWLGLALHNFITRRRHFQAVMQNSDSNLNTGRFLRLIALSSTEMLFSVPFSAWVLAENSRRLVPTDSWENIHYQWSRVIFISIASHSSSVQEYALTNFARWVPIFTAFLYFAFFGMQEEAMSGYSLAWACLVRGANTMTGLNGWRSPTLRSVKAVIPPAVVETWQFEPPLNLLSSCSCFQKSNLPIRFSPSPTRHYYRFAFRTGMEQ